jgi:hypothetical protein
VAVLSEEGVRFLVARRFELIQLEAILTALDRAATQSFRVV